jgi:small neutral amino acid transporter SnatA (MarC family)
VLSWRTKLEKLECLKWAGRRVWEKAKGSATTKLLLSLPQAMTPSVAGSSTIRYVFATNGATPPPPSAVVVVITLLAILVVLVQWLVLVCSGGNAGCRGWWSDANFIRG